MNMVYICKQMLTSAPVAHAIYTYLVLWHWQVCSLQRQIAFLATQCIFCPNTSTNISDSIGIVQQCLFHFIYQGWPHLDVPSNEDLRWLEHSLNTVALKNFIVENFFIIKGCPINNWLRGGIQTIVRKKWEPASKWQKMSFVSARRQRQNCLKVLGPTVTVGEAVTDRHRKYIWIN